MTYIVPAPDEVPSSWSLLKSPLVPIEWFSAGIGSKSASKTQEQFDLPLRAPQDTRILVVDDDDWIRDILERILLRHQYQVFTAPSAEAAWELLRFSSYDLIISDMMMTGMNGLELTARVRQVYPHIPIILITAHSDTDLMRTALRCGASDFIAKPFSIEMIPLVIERNLERRLIDGLRSAERDDTVMINAVQVLAAAIDAKEPFTAEHSRRVARVSVALGNAMRFSQEEVRYLECAAQVHDVGKIGVPDSILNKPERLTDDEWEEIRKHPVKGAEIVGRVKQLTYVADIVRHHHERVDGGGYPDNLHGEDIPILSRIIAVADAYEVMTADRVYRAHLSREEACCRLREASGTQFDEAVVDAFLQMRPTTLLL
jgi:putative two-component system response regulator